MFPLVRACFVLLAGILLCSAAFAEGYSVQWSTFVNADPSNMDAVKVIALPDGGAVLVSNVSVDATSSHVKVHRLGSNGSILATIPVAPTTGVQDLARTAFVSGSELFIGGTTVKAGSTSADDLLVIKVNLTGGNVAFRRIFDFATNLRQSFVDMAEVGEDIFITASERGSSAASTNTLTLVLQKFEGDIDWRQVKDIGGGKIDFPSSITVSGTDAYVACTSFPSLSAPKVHVLSYSLSGNERWLTNITNPQGVASARAKKVLTTSLGIVLVSEVQTTSGGTDRQQDVLGTAAGDVFLSKTVFDFETDVVASKGDEFGSGGFGGFEGFPEGVLQRTMDAVFLDRGEPTMFTFERQPLRGLYAQGIAITDELRPVHHVLVTEATRSFSGASLYGKPGQGIQLGSLASDTGSAVVDSRLSDVYVAFTLQGSIGRRISVNRINQVAVARPDEVQTNTGSPFVTPNLNILTNDFGLFQATLSRTAVSGAGEFDLQPLGNFTYTAPSTPGVNVFGYQISGPTGTSASTLTIVVQPTIKEVIAPASVTGGEPAFVRFLFDGPAAREGLLTGPGVSEVVPQGATSVDARVTTSPVKVDATFVSRVTFVRSQGSITIALLAPRPAQISLEPTSVVGGQPFTGRIILTGKTITTEETLVTLGDNSSAITVPAQTTVPRGERNGAFAGTTSPVATTATRQVSATLNGTTKTASLTLLPGAFVAFRINPSELVGGENATGTVTLSGPPQSGIDVAVTSGSGSILVPASVRVQAGATSQDFLVQTKAVGADAVRSVTASAGGKSLIVSVKLRPVFTIAQLSASPSTLKGGGSSTGTVVLNQGALPGGSKVLLSDNSGSISTPAEVVVAQGSVSATFAITTTAVTATATRQVTAAIGSSTRTIFITLTP